MVRAADDAGKGPAYLASHVPRNRAGSASLLRRTRHSPLSTIAAAGRPPGRPAALRPLACARVHDAALQAQLAYLERSSPFYRERIAGARRLADIPLLTKADLRASQAARPPFGDHLCAPREALVRLHVTSGTTGEPVAIGLTRADHEANSAIGGAAFAIAGLRPDDVIAHCLNYALYAGGIADHMAIEASGATVVPVGVGQSLRLLDLIPRLGLTAI
jgi:phenylacetate-CoA ligase